MLSFKSYLVEADLRQQVIELKSYIKRSFKSFKFTDSSRGAYHVRFPLAGSDKEMEKLFKKYNLEMQDYNLDPISGKFPTKNLVVTKTISPKLPAGTAIPWVNNHPGASVTGAQLFGNKELTPDSLGLAGKDLNVNQIISTIEVNLSKRFPPDVVADLVNMAKAAKTKNPKIKFNNTFSSKDLAKVSADFGEILSAIWAQSNLGFKTSFFPTASNEKLIDFYGVRFGIRYPISVKSGGGGKVTIQNIIDAINNRTKSATNNDMTKEPSLAIFKMVNELPMKEQMIELHKYMDTEAIRSLANIMGVRVSNVNLNSILNFVESGEQADLVKSLEPFWRVQNTVLTDRIKEGDDRLRLVISPLGESIWKILNNDKKIQDSLTRVARQVTLIQVNVDVTKTQITFKNNYFKDADFQFGWAGYAAKNKLGFKMKVRG